MEKAISILLVEDEVMSGMLMEEELKDFGYNVTEYVTTGEKAIISARQNPPDIVLMDIRLAGEMDGIEAASIIASKSEIPIIFITGYDDEKMREKAMLLKPLAYLMKPFRIGDIRKIIEAHFG